MQIASQWWRHRGNPLLLNCPSIKQRIRTETLSFVCCWTLISRRRKRAKHLSGLIEYKKWDEWTAAVWLHRYATGLLTRNSQTNKNTDTSSSSEWILLSVMRLPPPPPSSATALEKSLLSSFSSKWFLLCQVKALPHTHSVNYISTWVFWPPHATTTSAAAGNALGGASSSSSSSTAEGPENRSAVISLFSFFFTPHLLLIA